MYFLLILLNAHIFLQVLDFDFKNLLFTLKRIDFIFYSELPSHLHLKLLDSVALLLDLLVFDCHFFLESFDLEFEVLPLHIELGLQLLLFYLEQLAVFEVLSML